MSWCLYVGRVSQIASFRVRLILPIFAEKEPRNYHKNEIPKKMSIRPMNVCGEWGEKRRNKRHKQYSYSWKLCIEVDRFSPTVADKIQSVYVDI